MRLSEAIRLGAMLKPQAFGGKGAVGSCALRAATDAVGIPCLEFDGVESVNYGRLQQDFPITMHRFCAPCDCGDRHSTLEYRVYETVYHLNDVHHWTRERIADWVAGIEPVEAVTGGSEAARAATSDVLQRFAPEGVCVGVK